MTRSRARVSRDSARGAARASGGSRTLPDLVIEAAWLAGVALVPLLFNPRGWLTFYNDPKYVALHLAGLVIVIAWAWDWALSSRPAPVPGPSRLLEWAGRRPERWAVLFAGLFTLVAVISTALSPVRSVSLWGRDFTDLGYELYSVLALLAVFFAIAVRMRTAAQARRLMLTFAATGTVVALYGIAQRFDWDPVGPGEGAGRVFASFGNPILFGSFLLMTAVITTAITLGEHRDGRYRWLVGGAVALGLQLAALWFTGSRGPWIGYAAGGVAFAAIGYVWLDRRLVLKGMAVVGAAIALVFVIAFIPGAEGGSERNLGDLGTIFDESAAGSVGGRGPIWGAVLELSTSRAWEPEESAAAGLVRPFIGYGPEMFFYAYPLGLDVDQSGTVAQHAHNYPLQLLMELGLIGLVSFAAMSLLAIYAGGQALNRAKRAGEHHRWTSIAIAGLLAALLGRGLEQMAGVARVGDLLPFWALMGLLIAVVQITRRETANEPGTPDAAPRGGRRPEPRRAGRSGTRYLALGVAVAVTVAAAGLLYYRDVQTLRASAIARDAIELRELGRPDEALAKFERAVDLAPDVEMYHLQINDLFRVAAGVEESDGNNELAIVGWEGALSAAQRYADRNPKAFDTQKRLGQAESRLAALGRDGLAAVARDRYIAIAAALPSLMSAQTESARGLLAVGEDALGLEYADRALVMETPYSPNAEAWWLRGAALENLGERQAAAESYRTAIQRSPDSQEASDSHRGLARFYDTIGDTVAAGQERALAEAGE